MQQFKVYFTKPNFFSKFTTQVPYFIKEDNIINDPALYKDFIFIDNEEYQFKLKYNGYERGRSSLNISWQDTENDKIYYSSMNLLDKVLKDDKLVDGILSGRFCWKKKGTAVLLNLLNYT